MKKPQTKLSAPAPKSDEPRLSDLESRLARALADYQNLENRFGRESSAVIKFATAGLLQKLLTVRDHLEMAALQLKDSGLAMVLAQFDKVLQEEDVQEIPADGQFNPALMECQDHVPGPQDQVMRVVQKGYKLHDRVLRPARVVVGNGVGAE